MITSKLSRYAACLIAGISGLANAASFTVSNPSITDHGNASMTGTIANALAQCETTGGGTVFIEPGFYKTNSTLQLGKHCRIVGAGSGSTTIYMNSFSDLISVRSGQWSVHARWSIENIRLELNNGNNRHMIITTPTQANNGIIRNVTMGGGSPFSWGVRLDAALEIEISHLSYEGNGSGIYWDNSQLLAYNVGDSLIQNTQIRLVNPNTTGVYLASPTNSNQTSNGYRVNNILLSRVEVLDPGGVARTNTVGIKLRNAARITLLNVDIENMAVGLLQQSGVDGGAVATSNAFLQVFFLGCTSDYILEGSTPKKQTVLGGHGIFSDIQQLPSGTIYADHPVMGTNRVLTAARPIEAYTDTSTTRTLTALDSGKIFTNKDATGTITFNLPTANNNNSLEYEFHLVSAGKRIRVVPAAGDLIRPGQITTNSIYQSGDTFGQVLKIRNIDNTIWSVETQLGTWATVVP